MIRVYKVKDDKSSSYWTANDENSELFHIGPCDIDSSFMSLLINQLNSKFFELKMDNGEFKKLMLAEGYKQK